MNKNISKKDLIAYNPIRKGDYVLMRQKEIPDDLVNLGLESSAAIIEARRLHEEAVTLANKSKVKADYFFTRMEELFPQIDREGHTIGFRYDEVGELVLTTAKDEKESDGPDIGRILGKLFGGE